jgi:hypothetical protein
MNVSHNPALMRRMGWNFGIVACARDLHGNNFTEGIPNFQMEFLQHL